MKDKFTLWFCIFYQQALALVPFGVAEDGRTCKVAINHEGTPVFFPQIRSHWTKEAGPSLPKTRHFQTLLSTTEMTTRDKRSTR